MRRYILVILYILVHASLFAQKKGQERTDSLLLQIRLGHDTMKVRAMNVLATDWLRNKTDSGIQLSSAALILAKKIGYQRGEGDSYFSLGQLFSTKQNMDESLKNYQNALKIYEARNMNQWIGEASYAIGVIHQRTNLEECLKWFKKGLDAALKQPDKNLIGKIAFNTVNTYIRMGDYGENPVYYNNIALKAYTESGNLLGQANTYIANSRIAHRNGNYKQAIQENYNALRVYEKAPRTAGALVGMYNVHTGLGLIYEDQKNWKEVLNSYVAAHAAATEMANKDVLSGSTSNLGNVYRQMGKHELALKYFDESLKYSEAVSNKKYIATAKGNMASVYAEMGRHEEALKIHDEARRLFEEVGAKEAVGISYYETGLTYFNMKKYDESKIWTQKALDVSVPIGKKEQMTKAYQLMTSIDSARGDFVSAYKNYQQYIAFRDSMTSAETARQLIEQRVEYTFSKKEDSLKMEQALITEQLEKQRLFSRQQQQELELKQASLSLAQREKDLQRLSFLKTQAELQLSNAEKEKELQASEKEKAVQQSELDKQTVLSLQKEQDLQKKDRKLLVQKNQRNLLLGGAIGLVLISGYILYSLRGQRKVNDKLKNEQARTEQAMKDLKATQAQLIQSEKMASLGELTAGIAHEIQNPLNFVNNFAELNDEMLDEIKAELRTGRFDDALILIENIRDNNAKINHHGRRADGIVKGMLQHSRTSTGIKEPVDLNDLADEYLRLSYHGLRAKDKNFNSKFMVDFDEKVGRVEMVRQDMGRVLLNLLNNAFYAVNEKKKLARNHFEPNVSLTTKKSGNKVEITVKDNGVGIPQKALDKIYQPFFTTKPTGQGTGLGLSLSYDIIKAHGGDLKVKTKEGEFAEFVIELPAS